MNTITIEKNGSKTFAFGEFMGNNFDVEIIFGSGSFGKGEAQVYISHLESDEEIENYELLEEFITVEYTKF